MKLISLAPIILLAVLPAFGDSINSFTVAVVQPGGNVTLSPHADPVVGPSFCLPFCYLQFDISFPDPTTTTSYTISDSFRLGNQFYTSTDTLTCTPQENPGTCSVGVSFSPNCCSRTPVQGVFTVTVNGITAPLNFQYQSVVTPEPATAFLLGTGLTAVVSKRCRHNRQRPTQT